jgi:hypothetical protein
MTLASLSRAAAVSISLAGLTVAHAQTKPPARGHPVVDVVTPSKVVNEVVVDSPGSRYVATLPQAARDALRKDGQAILDKKTEGSGPSLLKAVVRFDRPKAEAWALITQPSTQHTYLPHVDESKLIGAHSEDGELNDYVVAFLFTFKYRTQHWFYADEARVEWNLDPAGGDGLTEQLGYWQLYELDSKTTIAEYGTHIVARGAFLNFLRSLGEKGAILDALGAFKKHIDTAKP